MRAIFAISIAPWRGRRSNCRRGTAATAAYLTTEQRELSAALLWLLKGDAAQRVICGLALWLASGTAASGQDWLAPFVAQLLQDPYGVVRYVARDALRRLPGFEEFEYDFLAPSGQTGRTRSDA